MPEKQFDTTKKEFFRYLDSLGISPKTHKNYRSDLGHFTEWLTLRVRTFGSYIESLTDGIPFLSKTLSQEYKAYLVENGVPVKTINRRLSTLRHLAKFMVLSNLTDLNFMDGVLNISEGKALKNISGPVIEEFRSYLVSEKVSESTVKNYVSDVRQFLSWLESNQPINQSTD